MMWYVILRLTTRMEIEQEVVMLEEDFLLLHQKQESSQLRFLAQRSIILNISIDT